VRGNSCSLFEHFIACLPFTNRILLHTYKQRKRETGGVCESTSSSSGSSGSKLLDEFAASSGKGGSDPRPEALAANLCAYQLVCGKRAVDGSAHWCQGLLSVVKRRRIRLETGGGVVAAAATESFAPCAPVPLSDADFDRVYAQRLIRKAEMEVESRVKALIN